jgi:hypothetical protein
MTEMFFYWIDCLFWGFLVTCININENLSKTCRNLKKNPSFSKEDKEWSVFYFTTPFLYPMTNSRILIRSWTERSLTPIERIVTFDLYQNNMWYKRCRFILCRSCNGYVHVSKFKWYMCMYLARYMRAEMSTCQEYLPS